MYSISILMTFIINTVNIVGYYTYLGLNLSESKREQNNYKQAALVDFETRMVFGSQLKSFTYRSLHPK